MHRGSLAFVFIIFAILGVSFWATTIFLFMEFADHSKPVAFNGELWFTLLTHYSDLFIFFPLFGTVALIAFYTPACVFVDMYWNIERQQDDAIPQSRLRFVFWFIVIAAFSFAIAVATHESPERSLWQLKPEVLEADKGEGCSGAQCGTRVSFIDGIENVRKLSRERLKITDLSRNCDPDKFIAPPKEPPPNRYCAASAKIEGSGKSLKTSWLDDRACCNAQFAYDKAVKATHKVASNRSRTDALQEQLWPLNIFFLMVLLVISVLLALRRSRIEAYYADCARSIDRGVIIGVLAVAFLAVMNRSFLEATQLLHGASGAASTHRGPDTFIVLFSIWALLILFSFVHPANKQAELVSRFLGVAASVLFVFNADTITNYGVRYLGAGAGMRSVILLIVVAIVMICALALLAHVRFMDDDRPADGQKKNGDQPPV